MDESISDRLEKRLLKKTKKLKSSNDTTKTAKEEIKKHRKALEILKAYDESNDK